MTLYSVKFKDNDYVFHIWCSNVAMLTRKLMLLTRSYQYTKEVEQITQMFEIEA